MRSQAAFWPFAFAGSLALHSMLTLAVSGLAHRIQEPPPLAELIIGEDAPFPAEVLAPSPAEVGTAVSAAQATSVEPAEAEAAPPVEAPSATSNENIAAADTATRQVAAAAPDEPLPPSPASPPSLTAAVEDQQIPAAATAQTAARVNDTQVSAAAQSSEAPVQQETATGEANPPPVAETAPADVAADAATLPSVPELTELLNPAPGQEQVPSSVADSAAPAMPSEETSLLSSSPDDPAEIIAAAPGANQTPLTASGSAAPTVETNQPSKTPAASPPETVEAPVAAPEPGIVQQAEPASPPQAPPRDKAAALQDVPTIVTKPAESVIAKPAPAPSAPQAQVAALQPATTPPESRAERMRRFLRNYDGGGCFFAVPVALDGSPPRIDGYGSRREPIFAFGEEFKRALGVAPDIGMRDLTDAQCPAIHFIGGLLKSRFPELRVRLDRDQIASGADLRGTIEGVQLRWLYLVLIDDDGMVQDLSQYLSKQDGRLTFAAPMYVQGQGRLRNQLLVGVATSHKLSLLKTDKPIRAEDFLPTVVDEADRKGADVALGVGAFRVK
jgi:serine/threonine-protein kinase